MSRVTRTAGQATLFGIPLIKLARAPQTLPAGVTQLAKDRTLVVRCGIGMERGRAPRLRFGCPPDLVLIYVVPAGAGR